MDAKGYLSDRIKKLGKDKGEPRVSEAYTAKALTILENNGYWDGIEGEIMHFHKNLSSPQKEWYNYGKEVRHYVDILRDVTSFVDLVFYGECSPGSKQSFHQSHLKDLWKANLEASEREKVLALEARSTEIYRRIFGVVAEMDISSISPKAVYLYDAIF